MIVLAGLFPAATVHAATISYADLLNRAPPLANEHLAYGSDPDQFGELWLPEGRGPYPVVVMIHGGCWQESLPGVVLMAYLADDMRRSGFAVWNLEYRRLGAAGAGYPGTFLDIASGVDYLRRIEQPYHLDLSHLIAVGHSAGGHLALWAAARRRIDRASALYESDPLPIAYVVTLGGIDDLRAYRDSDAIACGGSATIDRLIGVGARQDQSPYADTSPSALLPLGVAQLIVSGSLDPIVPSRFGKDYGLAARAAGDQVKIVDVAGAGHFELIDPGSAAWAATRFDILSHAHVRP